MYGSQADTKTFKIHYACKDVLALAFSSKQHRA